MWKRPNTSFNIRIFEYNRNEHIVAEYITKKYNPSVHHFIIAVLVTATCFGHIK